MAKRGGRGDRPHHRRLRTSRRTRHTPPCPHDDPRRGLHQRELVHGADDEHGHVLRLPGWVAFSINYRLAGDHGTLPSFFPEIDDPDPRRVEQIHAIYTACRDAKAAIRWIRANAGTYGIDTERITASGGSAGSITAVGLGVVNESDCNDELTVDDDPTLATTNPGESSEIHTIIDHWGSAAMVLVVEALNGGDSRFDATDAPISIVHGTADPTVAFDKAEQLEAAYAETGVPYAYHPLPGAGHGAWQHAPDGKSLFELAFDFIVEQQELPVR